MDSEADAKARDEQNRPTRSKRVVERFDVERGVWHRVEITEDDELYEMNPDIKAAYLDIVTSISDLMVTGNMGKEKN